MHIPCPHCHEEIAVADGGADEAVCPTCGSSFRLCDTSLTATVAEAQQLGRFELYDRVGVGAFGAVWKARDKELDRVVAVKLLHASMVATAADRERFLREARAAAQLRHPGIVTVHEVTELNGVPTIVSDFIDGMTLRDLLEARRLAFREAAELVAQVAEALDYAHSLKVVHRDIKPANIMIQFSPGENLGMALDQPVSSSSQSARSGWESRSSSSSVRSSRPRALLLDFGLALRDEAEVTLTADGQIIGTPAYMSPEQAAGRSHRVDRRSDIYSLGVLLYELLCGEMPFRGSKVMMIHQVLYEEPRPPRQVNDRVPSDLETICLKAMAKEPAARYQTARDFAVDLRRYLAGEVILARPVGRLERAWKWARRRPAAAGLLVSSIVATLALVAVAVATFYNTRLARAYAEADAARIAAQSSQQAESQERARAETARAEAELYLYFNRIVLAEHEWRTNNVARAEHLLDLCRSELRGWEWHYLKRLCRSELHTFDGHTGPIYSVAVSPDDRWIATASVDKTVGVWDVPMRQLVRKLAGHTQRVDSVDFSKDGKRLVSAGGAFNEPGELIVWDTQTWNELLRLSGQAGQISSVAFSPDGRRIALGSGDWDRPFRIAVLDAATGTELLAFNDLDQAPMRVRFSPDGRHVAAVLGAWNAYDPKQRPGKVLVWDASSGALQFTLPEPHSPLISFDYSPDGRWLASTSWDRSAKVWDLESRRVALALRGHTHFVTAVAFSRDGKRIATASEDSSVRVWDAASGDELRVLRGHSGPVSDVVFSSDDRYVFSAGDDMTTRIWDPERGSELTVLGEFSSWVTSLSISRDGSRIAAGSIAETVRVWDSETGAIAFERSDLPAHVWSVAFSPDGRRLACGLGDWTKPDEPAELKILDAATGREYHSLRGHKGLVWSVAFSPDGQRIASAGGELGTPDAVKIWNTVTGAEIATLPSPNGGVPSVAFSPDGSRLAAALGPAVQVWDTADWKELTRFTGHSEPVISLVFSPDGRQIASCGADMTARLWEIETGVERSRMPHSHYVQHVSFSPDGSRLATASFDHTIKLWDRATGQEILTLRGHTRPVTAVAFTPDGRRFITGSHDHTVKIWDARLPDPQ